MKNYLLGALLVRLSEPGIDMAGTNIWSSVILGIKQKNKFVCQSLFSNFSFPFSLSYFCNGGQSYRSVGIIVKMVGNYMTAPLSLPLQPAYHMAEMQIEIPVYDMAEIPVYNMTEIPVYNMTEMQIQILFLW